MNRMKEINSELSAARNSNASFVSSLAQKDQELDSLRRELERSESVSSPDVESPDDNPSVAPSAADTRRSLIETNGGCRAPTEKAESLLEIVEGLQRKEEEYVKLVINYHQEREQLYMAVQFHQNEALEAKNNVSRSGMMVVVMMMMMMMMMMMLVVVVVMMMMMMMLVVVMMMMLMVVVMMMLVI